MTSVITDLFEATALLAPRGITVTSRPNPRRAERAPHNIPTYGQDTYQLTSYTGAAPIRYGPVPGQEEDTTFLDLATIPEKDHGGIRNMIHSYARKPR